MIVCYYLTFRIKLKLLKLYCKSKWTSIIFQDKTCLFNKSIIRKVVAFRFFRSVKRQFSSYVCLPGLNLHCTSIGQPVSFTKISCSYVNIFYLASISDQYNFNVLVYYHVRKIYYKQPLNQNNNVLSVCVY